MEDSYARYLRLVSARSELASIRSRLDSTEGEEWRAIPGFLRYEISSRGCVRRVGARGKQPRVFNRLDGRLAVRLTSASSTVIRSVERLVEEAFK